MNNESKARMYGELLNEHTRVGNLISEVKAENFEMNDEQNTRIRVLENKQIQIMMAIKKINVITKNHLIRWFFNLTLSIF